MGLFGILLFALIQLIFFGALFFLWIKMKRSMDDDSRWSRGMQYLQKKIAIFEDLSDRTENQVQQLTLVMENKICDLQKKIDEADQVLRKISTSMQKSIEVAQIFQDRIPHEEIIERQNTVKFVKAALMAHEGKSLLEIGRAVDLPTSQIEFIIKVNSDRLTFDANQIPEWLKEELKKDPLIESRLSHLNQVRPSGSEVPRSSFTPAADLPVLSSEDLSHKPMKREDLESNRDSDAISMAQGALNKKAKEMGIRPVLFPRIEVPRKNSKPLEL